MSDHELPRIQENATKKELEDIVDRFLREVDSVDYEKMSLWISLRCVRMSGRYWHHRRISREE